MPIILDIKAAGERAMRISDFVPYHPARGRIGGYQRGAQIGKLKCLRQMDGIGGAQAKEELRHLGA